MKLFLILLMLCSQSIKLLCQQKTRAKIDFKIYKYDFGVVNKEDGEKVYSFEFINTGQLPLIINNVKQSCDCIIPKWPSDSLAPGAKGYIRVNFNPVEVIGSFNEEITVFSNGNNDKVILNLTGSVIDSIPVDGYRAKIGELSLKAKHINLGNIYKGETKLVSLPIANFSDNSVTISFTNVPLYINAIAEPSSLKPGEKGKVIIKFDSKKTDEWDNTIDRITPVINNKKLSAERLAITATIKEDFRNIKPEELPFVPVAYFQSTIINFDTLLTKLPVSNNFLIRNDGKTDLIIRDVNPSCGCTAVKPEKNILNPGDSTFINVIFNPKDLSGDFKKGITIITNDPKLSRQYLWIKGYIKE